MYMNTFFSQRIKIALVLFLVIIITGTVGYILIEDYNILDAVYMVIISITTVGFGEIKPLSPAGRIFTMLLILIGIGSLGFIVTSIAESFIERILSGRAGLKKMKKKIQNLDSHYIVCGYGRVGAAAVEEFDHQKADFVIIENNPEFCDKIKNKNYLFVEGDATHEDILLDAGIKSAKGLMALLASEPNNLFIVLTSRELNPMLHIIARSEETSSEKRILQAGANRVISPFHSAGKQIADDILAITGQSKKPAKVISGVETAPQWVTVQEGSSMAGQTIKKMSEEMGREIIGLRTSDHDYIFPQPDIKIENGNMLLVIDEKRDIEVQKSQRPPEPQKVVIVDDNPVILRLYVRLFQKAGFNPLTATNGGEGLDLIIREKPVAAIIDFMLPVLSGIEICREVRQNKECKNIKLILFTGDDKLETRKSAITAGADEVVVKTPEAFEIIKAAIKLIKDEAD